MSRDVEIKQDGTQVEDAARYIDFVGLTVEAAADNGVTVTGGGGSFSGDASDIPLASEVAGASDVQGALEGLSGATGSGAPVAGSDQSYAIEGTPTTGTFTVTFRAQTTTAIPFDATSDTICAAIAALSTVGPGNIRSYPGYEAYTLSGDNVVYPQLVGSLSWQAVEAFTITDGTDGGLAVSEDSAGEAGSPDIREPEAGFVYVDQDISSDAVTGRYWMYDPAFGLYDALLTKTGTQDLDLHVAGLIVSGYLSTVNDDLSVSVAEILMNAGGSYDGGGGNIVTSGGWLGTSDEFAVGVVGMWAGAADPTAGVGIGGFNRGTIWQRVANSGELWLKSADDVNQKTRVAVDATGGTFTLLINGVETGAIDFDFFQADYAILNAALMVAAPIWNYGKSRALIGASIDVIPPVPEMVVEFQRLMGGQAVTVAEGANSLTGGTGIVTITTDQAGANANAWMLLGTQAAHIADGSTVDQLRDALIASGLMAAS